MWFRVDDRLAFHEKAINAGNPAMGLWVRAGSWCGEYLTDGEVPVTMARSLGSSREASALVRSGLWVVTDTGYQFHDWEDFQPSRADAQVLRETQREAGREANHVRWHVRRGVVGSDCKWCADHPPALGAPIR